MYIQPLSLFFLVHFFRSQIMAPNNSLVIHGNEKTMNLNTLLLTNIQSSSYFKVHLYEFKTYHQVVDEIYYKVRYGLCRYLLDSIC